MQSSQRRVSSHSAYKSCGRAYHDSTFKTVSSVMRLSIVEITSSRSTPLEV